MSDKKPKVLRVATSAAPEQDLPLDVKGVPVRLRVRSNSTVLIERAEWAARLAVEEADKPENGGPLDRAGRLGVYFASYVAEVGKAAIVGWDVVDDQDKPIPCDPETVARVLSLNPDLAHAFDRRYSKLTADRRTEGNVSAPAPNGTSAAGANTALAAAPTLTTPTNGSAPNART